MTDNEVKASPWDVFINLFAVIALFASLWSGLYAVFCIVDLILPDSLDRSISLRDGIRIALAILIIFFPAHVWAWRTVDSDLAEHPDKRARWLRTCPIYLTLFVTGLLALGDLSCLLYYFLMGDLTIRFLLKVAAVAIVAGATFGFYLYSLRREPGRYSAGARVFALATSAAVAILTIGGIAIAGSPTRARLQRLDAKRLRDLDLIQDEVAKYWKSKQKLPGSIADLNDPMAGFVVPKDPESGRPYDYSVSSPTTFKLCADFALADHVADQSIREYIWESENSDGLWNHQAGHSCYSRTIDPSR